MEAELLKIMYAPHSYMKQEYLAALPDVVLATQSHSLSSQLIMEHYNLLRNVDFSFAPGPLLSAVIRGWQYIPRVAILLGCYLLRPPLIFSGIARRFDANCQAFMALPLGISLPPQPLTALTTETIQDTGAGALIATLENFSPALTQRARLMFSDLTAHKAFIIAPSTLIMAFDYAKIS